MTAAALFRLEGVSFAYDPARPVLRGADFRLHAGERVALVGPNGAGKTTLFHLMVGLLRPSAGTVEAFGAVRVREKDFHGVRLRAGLLFQDSDDQLFCPTVVEDVAFGPLNRGLAPRMARARALETLAALGLEGFADRVTHRLSGGEKRLVALATVLAMEPEVLLLDEPTNALDAATAERLTSVLESLPQAMVVIAHDEALLARITRRRVRLEAGRLVEG
ncbi:energy-coupling factor ABC transporter ATP-binding protein [Azospirillum halopraeferens]|uniref:energy-coupling factor ABC transporter ATP-binding protein n=1 Tax=Azospirillum halopraeferens TaxID=34010 RepID=UPI0004106BEA|nr:ABC transporter ATP-binding protein [Azospirillum halopraeferens]